MKQPNTPSTVLRRCSCSRRKAWCSDISINVNADAGASSASRSCVLRTVSPLRGSLRKTESIARGRLPACTLARGSDPFGRPVHTLGGGRALRGCHGCRSICAVVPEQERLVSQGHHFCKFFFSNSYGTRIVLVALRSWIYLEPILDL